MGDEIHYLLVCPFFKNKRKQLIDCYFYKYPNILKFIELLETTNKEKLFKVSIFMGYLITFFL